VTGVQTCALPIYAATLEERAAEDYAAAFDRAAGRRFPALRPHLP